ncbi:MAG TPA: hypothetical protein VK786_03315 [bacterium]|jgi:hypothetical protein|nr:hypothetical protein [bacterium]
MFKLLRAASLFCCVLSPGFPAICRADAAPFTPFHAKFFLVAGSGESGYRDGQFLDADFKDPEGLALSKDQARLYVADTGNHAVRVIALDAQDRVSTLVGNGSSGMLDGAGSASRLSSPSLLALSGDGMGLWVLDQAGTALRYVDLGSGAIRSMAPAPRVPAYTAMAVAKPDAAGSTGDAVFLVGQGGLYRWKGAFPAGAGQGPPPELLVQDPRLACPSGRLVALDQALYFVSPCDGNTYAVGVPQSLSPTVSNQVSNQVTSSASGFCPFEEAPENWKILFWDPIAASFARLAPAPGSGAQVYPLSDYQGTPLPGPSGYMIGINATSDRRTMVPGDVNMAVGAAGVFYVCERACNRVIGVDSPLIFGNGDDVNNVRQTENPKPAGCIRLAVLGSSLSFYWWDGSPENRENINLSLVRELELRLNLESALKGTGKRYEVLPFVRRLGEMNGSPSTFMFELGDELWSRQIDEVLIQVDYQTLWREVTTFCYNQTVDDLAVMGFQDEWADWQYMDGAQRYRKLGPLTRGLIDWVREHPKESEGVAHFDGKGKLVFDDDRDLYQLLSVPRIREFALAVMRKALLKCKAEAKAHGASVAIYLLPTRNLVEVGELGGDAEIQARVGGLFTDDDDHINPAFMDKPLADMAAGIGVPCYNLTEAMRLVAVPMYPLIIPGDQHYNARAQGWIAEILARQITGDLPSYAPDRDSPAPIPYGP